jgi:hypothetical protein
MRPYAINNFCSGHQSYSLEQRKHLKECQEKLKIPEYEARL